MAKQLNWEWYRRTPLREMKKMKVRSRIEFLTKEAAVPAGTVFTIDDKFGSLHLRSEPCAHCGRSVYVSGIFPIELDIVEDE